MDWLDEVTLDDLTKHGFFGSILACTVVTDYKLKTRLTQNPRDIIVVGTKPNKVFGYYRAERGLTLNELIEAEMRNWI